MKFDELLQRAQLSVKIHDYEEAIKFVTKAIEINNEMPSIYLLLGSIYQKNHDYDNAVANYEITLSKDPKCIEAYNNLGVISKNLGNFDKALDYFKQALAINNKRADIYYNLGNTYKLMGKLDLAKENFEKTLKLKPDYVSSYNNLGNIFDTLGEYNEAIATYQKGLKIDLNNLKLHYNIGITFEKMNNLHEALTHYKKAIELNPNCVEAHNNLGIIYDKMDNLDDARNCYEDVLSLNPNFSKARNNLARIYERQGSNDKAIEQYRKALELEPNYDVALQNIGRLYYDQGDYEDARQAFEKLSQMNDKDYESKYNLAKSTQNVSPADSVEIYKQLLDMTSDNDETVALHKTLGNIFQQLNDNDEAMKHYEEASKLAPNDIDNRIYMADIYRSKGNISRAVELLEQTLTLDGNNKAVLEKLGSAYMESNQNDKAINIYTKLKNIDPNDNVIFNLAKAYKNIGDYDNAIQYMQQILSVDGGGSLLDLDNFDEKLKVYEETLQSIAQRNEQESRTVREELKKYTMDDLLNGTDDSAEQMEENDFTELEEHLVQNNDNDRIISYGDNAPEYAIDEEEEVIDTTKADIEEDDDESDSMFNLLKGQDTYDEMIYRQKRDQLLDDMLRNQQMAMEMPAPQITMNAAGDESRLQYLEDALSAVIEQMGTTFQKKQEAESEELSEVDALKQQIEELTQQLEKAKAGELSDEDEDGELSDENSDEESDEENVANDEDDENPVSVSEEEDDEDYDDSDDKSDNPYEDYDEEEPESDDASEDDDDDYLDDDNDINEEDSDTLDENAGNLLQMNLDDDENDLIIVNDGEEYIHVDEEDDDDIPDDPEPLEPTPSLRPETTPDVNNSQINIEAANINGAENQTVFENANTHINHEGEENLALQQDNYLEHKEEGDSQWDYSGISMESEGEEKLADESDNDIAIAEESDDDDIPSDDTNSDDINNEENTLPDNADESPDLLHYSTENEEIPTSSEPDENIIMDESLHITTNIINGIIVEIVE